MADNSPKFTFSQVSHALHSSGSFDTPPSNSEVPAMESPDTKMVEFNSSTPRNNTKNDERELSEATKYMFVSQNPSSKVTTPVSKRPRGRPPLSKKNPKPPTNTTKHNDSTLIPLLIEVTPGNDIIEAIINVARDRHMGIYIMSGIGLISYAFIRNPLAPEQEQHIKGPINMLTLNGAYFGGRFMPLPLPLLHPLLAPNSPLSPSLCSSFTTVLSGADAQLIGGLVVGKVIAADTVRVMTVLIEKPEFVRFSLSVHDYDKGYNDINKGEQNNGNNTLFASSESNGVKVDVPVVAARGGGENFNTTLPYIAGTYGFIGSDEGVCDVSVMECLNHGNTNHAD